MGRKKKKLLIGFILIGLLIIFSSLFFGFFDNGLSFFQLEGISRKILDSSCPDYIIPEKISFEIYEGQSLPNVRAYGLGGEGLYMHISRSYLPRTKWADGSQVLFWHNKTEFNMDSRKLITKEISESPSIWVNPVCFKGSKEGQNVNFYYCDNLAYINNSQPISDSGDIGKEIIKEFEVDLILSEISRETIYSQDFGFTNAYYTFGEFEVIDSRCHEK